jgi:CRISPR-associated protein Csb2
MPARGDFDPRLVILRRTGGDGSPGLLQAPAFVAAMRATLLSHAGERSKVLISGHQPDGSAMQAAHINWIPLAFVGSDYADAHLMGMAIALPHGIAADDEQAFFDTLADSMSVNGKMELRAGSAGCMVLEEADAPGQPYALRQQTWTRPSSWWGTVTPIVLDRLPPRRHKDHDVWAAEQVARSCERQGLPVPVDVQILSISPFTGSPTCRSFPPLRRRSDGAKQWHVHARICFEENVGGPLILGAGRYRGYGLCKPMQVEI